MKTISVQNLSLQTISDICVVIWYNEWGQVIMTQRYMQRKQATEYLGITKDTLYQLVKKRSIPYGKRGKTLVFDRVKIDEWLDTCHSIYGVTLEEAVQNHIKKGHSL